MKKIITILFFVFALPIICHAGLWGKNWDVSGSSGGGGTTDITGKLDKLYTINKPTTKAYTFVLTDVTTNTLVMADNASAQTYTVPGTTAVAIPIGSQLNVVQSGAGKLTFAGAGGVTLNSKAGDKAAGAQYVGLTLIKTDNATWQLFGSLQP